MIGGGATGVGVAVDAAARGLDVVLVEAHDFGKGTSSRSTKLVHGGVRYLEQGNIPLVMSALKERGLLRQNAPHLVHDLAFVVPNYSWWEAPFYGIGLKLYDLLAGKYGFGPSRLLSREETLAQLPALEPEELRGGVVYYDGQFDDARLLIHLAMTAADHGATLVNYCPATGLLRDEEGYVNGLTARDEETGEELTISARIVVNATGVFTDSVRRMADAKAEPLMVTSQGIHLVFDRSFLERRYGADGAADQRWACAVCDSVARARRCRNDGHAGGCAEPGTEGVRRGDRIHSRDGGAISEPSADAARTCWRSMWGCGRW